VTHSSSYEILELTAGATLDQVKAAYRRLAPQVHPDLGGSHELFRQVREAYVTLTRDLSRDQAKGPSYPGAPPRHTVPALGRAGTPVRDQRTKWVKALLAQERAVSPHFCVTA
jgi:hypothetical protein